MNPFNRFQSRPAGAEESSEDRRGAAQHERVMRAFMRGRRGEALAAESSSGSSIFGSLVWDSDKLEEAFPSEGDKDPLAYKCEYVEGPRFLKYMSGNRMRRWHGAATERFEQLQNMDSDEFVDGVDDEIKYERDLYRDAVVNVNGTRMVVSKAPFFEGEAGYVGKNGEMIPGPEVRHTRALMTEEMEHLDVREQQRYDELYGKDRVDKQNAWMALEDLEDVGGDAELWRNVTGAAGRNYQKSVS